MESWTSYHRRSACSDHVQIKKKIVAGLFAKTSFQSSLQSMYQHELVQLYTCYMECVLETTQEL